MKLFDSELNVMAILWKEGDMTAKRLVEILRERIGWNKATTYTVIQRCIAKGAIERSEPNFICRPLVSVEQARNYETTELLDKMFDGRADKLMVSLLNDKKLSSVEIQRLKDIVNTLE